MKYTDLKTHLVVKTPDGRHGTITTYGPLIVDLSDNDIEMAKVTVRLTNQTIAHFRAHQLEPGNENIMAQEAMAHMFPTPKE